MFVTGTWTVSRSPGLNSCDESRGAPSLSYYEGLGRSNFKAAGDHRLARTYALDGIFNDLAERFQETRRALNDLRDRLITLGEPDFSIDALLKGPAGPT